MAVIVVNTVDDVRPPEPTIPTLAEGVPLDFEFYAVRTHGGSPAEAIEKALLEQETAAQESRPESIALPDSVIAGGLLTNPCLYADPAGIASGERIPARWLDLVSGRQACIADTPRAVGRIQLYHFVPARTADVWIQTSGYEVGLIVGTGIVVAPGMVMTNRHVAELFAQAEPTGPSFRTDERLNEPVVLIDFGGVY